MVIADLQEHLIMRSGDVCQRRARGDCLADGIVSMSYVLWETLVWNILNTHAEATGEFFLLFLFHFFFFFAVN